MFVHPVRMRPVRMRPVRGCPVIGREFAYVHEAKLIFGEEAVVAQDAAYPDTAGMRRRGFDDIIERQSARGLRFDGIKQINIRSEAHHPVIVEKRLDAWVGEHLANDVADELRF